MTLTIKIRIFQSLIGILQNCKEGALGPKIWHFKFQSLIGILQNCKCRDDDYLEEYGGISIPNRDSPKL